MSKDWNKNNEGAGSGNEPPKATNVSKDWNKFKLEEKVIEEEIPSVKKTWTFSAMTWVWLFFVCLLTAYFKGIIVLFSISFLVLLVWIFIVTRKMWILNKMKLWLYYTITAVIAIFSLFFFRPLMSDIINYFVHKK